MGRIVRLMLGLSVLATPAGLAAAEDLVEPTIVADDLTDAERGFQGVWQLRSDGSGSDTGTLRIDGRAFSAETIHGSYQGHVSIRPDASPPQIDVTVVGCDCNLEGKTSQGIFRREQDGSVVFAWPAPDEPRPTSFDGLDGSRFLIERATRVVERRGGGDGATPR